MIISGLLMAPILRQARCRTENSHQFGNWKRDNVAAPDTELPELQGQDV